MRGFVLGIPEFSGIFDHDSSGQSIAIQGMTLVGDSIAERANEVAHEVEARLKDAGVVLNVKDVQKLRIDAYRQVRNTYLKEVV